MFRLNNRDELLTEELSVSDLLIRKKYTYSGIIVKINGKVIEDHNYDETKISENDDVKIIHICHGG